MTISASRWCLPILTAGLWSCGVLPADKPAAVDTSTLSSQLLAEAQDYHEFWHTTTPAGRQLLIQQSLTLSLGKLATLIESPDLRSSPLTTILSSWSEAGASNLTLGAVLVRLHVEPSLLNETDYVQALSVADADDAAAYLDFSRGQAPATALGLLSRGPISLPRYTPELCGDILNKFAAQSGRRQFSGLMDRILTKGLLAQSSGATKFAENRVQGTSQILGLTDMRSLAWYCFNAPIPGDRFDYTRFGNQGAGVAQMQSALKSTTCSSGASNSISTNMAHSSGAVDAGYESDDDILINPPRIGASSSSFIISGNCGMQ